MAQAKGALMQVLFQKEAAFRTEPAVPGAFKLPFTSYNLGRDPKKTKDPSISSSPLPGKSGCGDATVEGNIKAILDLRSVGFWLMLALGVPTTHAAVTRQPTNITGVTVNYAESGTTAGNGTLAFTFTGKTLSWMAQGDVTPGTPVDVSAGGYFTLQSSTALHSIHVTVDVAALPGVDKSDADIAVSATIKTHAYPLDLNDRPSALLEIGHSDITKFYRTLGAKVNKLSYDLVSQEQNISLDIIAGEESEKTSVWDAAPTSYNSLRACGSGGAITNGVDASLGQVIGGDFAIDNGMKGVPLADGMEGYGLIDQGEVMLSGSVNTVFDGAGSYALARASTSTRMRLISQADSGTGIFSLVWDLPFVELIEKVIPKEGKSGLSASLQWNAHRDVSGRLPLCLLTNDVASY
ncbi:MAG: hypothetical protein K8H84_03340 [Sulfuricella denitrificans]|nr:hypothetical protein [Sulfuricella denitrificans]